MVTLQTVLIDLDRGKAVWVLEDVASETWNNSETLLRPFGGPEWLTAPSSVDLTEQLLARAAKRLFPKSFREQR